jgi:hypothetical protein
MGEQYSPGLDWLTVAQVAQRQGVTSSAIRAALKVGSIVGVKVAAVGKGPARWLIDPASLPTSVFEATSSRVPAPAQTSTTPDPFSEALLREMATSASRVHELEGERLRSRVEELERELERVQREMGGQITKLQSMLAMEFDVDRLRKQQLTVSLGMTPEQTDR